MEGKPKSRMEQNLLEKLYLDDYFVNSGNSRNPDLKLDKPEEAEAW